MVKRFSLFIIVTLFCFLFSSLLFSGAATYVGIKKCKMCHMKQFKVWETTKHAKATEPAEKKDAKCSSCHGVMAEHTCEACHGPGSMYAKSKDTMKKEEYLKNGGLVAHDQCVNCHNDKTPPGHKKITFDYKTAYEKIKHTK